MPLCKSCLRRRRLLAAGHAKGGIVGAVKAVPAVVRDVAARGREAVLPLYRQPVVRETRPGGAGQ